MRFVILRLLRHNELGMFHSYRRLGKERSKQRAINFDGDVVDRVFPAAKDTDSVPMVLRYETDKGIVGREHWVKRQGKNWRLEGNCPKDRIYDFVDPGCLFAMVLDSGKRPAHGAWAVFPSEYAVTKGILANAESSALTSRPMVALHRDEGDLILALLRKFKPELFGSEEMPVPTKPTKTAPPTKKGKGVHLPPNPKRLVRILASVGHTLPSAVADIVDNAISAGANAIRITFGRPDEGHGRWMAIADDGRGMDSDRLAEAMRIGSEAEYSSKDLGKYGYGLKGASWSQTDSFMVVSTQAKKKAISLAWDIATMEGWEAEEGVVEPWMAKAADVGAHGTCVVWKDMRMPQSAPVAKMTDPHTSEIMDLERHLGLVFHRFISGNVQGRGPVTIRINGMPEVQANDPVGHALATQQDNKTIRFPLAEAEPARVGVKVFVLPSVAEVKAMHKGDAEATRRDQDKLSLCGRANESQGLYVYRNDRLICWGGWHKMWATMDEKTKLARVTVDFGKDLDDSFAVNISKQIVVLPQYLQVEIKKLAEPARNESRKKYLKDKRPVRSSTSPGPNGPNVAGNTGGAGAPVGGHGAASRTPGAPAAGGKAYRSSGVGSGPQIPVRIVKNATFAWKVGRSMSGSKEVQVSDEELALNVLLTAVGGDSAALAALVGFLERLDLAGVQKTLLAAKG